MSLIESILDSEEVAQVIAGQIKPDTEVIKFIEAGIDLVRKDYLNKRLPSEDQKINDQEYRKLLARREEWIETGR